MIGRNFVQTGISVSVGGRECANPIVPASLNGTEVHCILPESSGGVARSVLVVSFGQASNPGFASYGKELQLSIFEVGYILFLVL